MALGRPPLSAVLGTTLRLAAPGVAAGMALVGPRHHQRADRDPDAGPNGTRTLATEFWSLTGEIDYAPPRPMRC